MIIVVAYDISNHGLRRHVALALRRSGWRVQKSVFECDLDARDTVRLERRLTGLIADGSPNDSIRIYRLCAACADRIFSVGAGATSSRRRRIVVIGAV